MTEWSDDPMEVRLTCFGQAKEINKGAKLSKILKDAAKIENYIKAAKPKAKVLKIVNKNRNNPVK